MDIQGVFASTTSATASGSFTGQVSDNLSMCGAVEADGASGSPLKWPSYMWVSLLQGQLSAENASVR